MEADGLQLADEAIQLAHVAVPRPAPRSLLAGQHRGDGLAPHLACPDGVGAVQDWGIGLAAARLLPARHEALADAAAQDEAEVGDLGEPRTVLLIE